MIDFAKLFNNHIVVPVGDDWDDVSNIGIALGAEAAHIYKLYGDQMYRILTITLEDMDKICAAYLKRRGLIEDI